MAPETQNPRPLNPLELLNLIQHSDCFDLMEQIPDNFCDIAITSPPYNIGLRTSRGKIKKAKEDDIIPDLYYSGVNSRKFSDINMKYRTAGTNPYPEMAEGGARAALTYTDDLSIQDYFLFQNKIISELIRTTKGYVFYNIQALTGNKLAIFKIIGQFAANIKEIIIWDKKHAEVTISKIPMLKSEYELIIVFTKAINAVTRSYDTAYFDRNEGLSNILRLPKQKSNKKNIFSISGEDFDWADHKAQFPMELPTHFIKYFTKPGDIVCDPFSGSGTTAYASMLLGRHFLCCDSNKYYCDKSNLTVSRLRKALNI